MSPARVAVLLAERSPLASSAPRPSCTAQLSVEKAPEASISGSDGGAENRVAPKLTWIGTCRSATECAPSSPPSSIANMLADPTQQVLALGRGGGPHGLEVSGGTASQLHIGVQATTVWIGVEVQERLVSQVEVRAVAVSSGHVYEPVDGAKCFDELRVGDPAPVVVLRGLALGQRRPRPRTAMAIKLLVTTRHRDSLYLEALPAATTYSSAGATPHGAMVGVGSAMYWHG